jgi:cytochrome c-type biogenesis protein CcmF
MDINYVGEHTFIGQFGHLLAIISLVGAGLSLFSYYRSEQDQNWLGLGRSAFRIHSIAVLGIIAAMFWMLLNQYFEYDYVWKHSNSTMPLRYILSCFWEGQEGSFLLWTFWHMVLGNILITRSGKWEGPVMAVFALVQLCLATMILGIYVGDYRVGSSPFILTRELPDYLGLPWTQIPNYIETIPQFADGRGLNPLLQNYWMTIHPPTLFFGFAATLVPFAYAISGLWRRDLQGWIKPALPWTYLAIGILGIGILMGGAWAYEALSFGGFWAWDPVENASLVPWLILVGAGHLMLINQRKGTSLFTTFFLILSSFILIMYSTYLTRSGVLGDTSVHSFTGDGMIGQLVVYLLLFIALSTAMLVQDVKQRHFYWSVSAALLFIGLFLEMEVPAVLLFIAVSVYFLTLSYRKYFPKSEEEEETWSREFWLFIGAIVLTLSALQISFTTSIPVTNILIEPFGWFFQKLADWTAISFFQDLATAKLAPPSDVIEHYNKWQVPFAFIITLLIAIGQYLSYKKTDLKRFRKKLLVSVISSVVLTVILALLLDYGIAEMSLSALLFSSIFAVVANGAYIWKGLNGKFKLAGPSIAHVGFGLVMLGALISTSGSEEVSRNGGSMDLRFLSQEFSNNTDILLYKNDMVRMGDHFVSYRGKTQDGVNLRYQVDYFNAEPKAYKAGDLVSISGATFRANADHNASEEFLLDQPTYWEAQPTDIAYNTNIPAWSSAQIGDSVFRLEPFVQLNPRFGNVAEPSTRHWLHKDLYSHVRYADMEPDSAGTDMDRYMPARVYEKSFGDTIVTPTAVIILDSLKVVRDSLTARLMSPEHTVVILRIRVRHLLDPDSWTTETPMIFFKNNDVVGTKDVELPQMRIKIGIDKIDPEKVSLNVYDEEFVVMQAIVFPGINILWIGCILMFVGTIMAVWRRIKPKPSS